MIYSIKENNSSTASGFLSFSTEIHWRLPINYCSIYRCIIVLQRSLRMWINAMGGFFGMGHSKSSLEVSSECGRCPVSFKDIIFEGRFPYNSIRVMLQ